MSVTSFYKTNKNELRKISNLKGLYIVFIYIEDLKDKYTNNLQVAVALTVQMSCNNMTSNLSKEDKETITYYKKTSLEYFL